MKDQTVTGLSLAEDALLPVASESAPLDTVLHILPSVACKYLF